MIHGYASHKQTNETIYWSGQIDAIGVKKDGTIIVVDWKLCKGLLSEFWDHADDFSWKLHQTMIYWKLVKAHCECFYREEKVPMVDILLVPMSSSAKITDGDPRICHDFRALQDNGFFNIIDEYHWTVQRPRRKGSSPRCEHETDEVRSKAFCIFKPRTSEQFQCFFARYASCNCMLNALQTPGI